MAVEAIRIEKHIQYALRLLRAFHDDLGFFKLEEQRAALGIGGILRFGLIFTKSRIGQKRSRDKHCLDEHFHLNQDPFLKMTPEFTQITPRGSMLRLVK